MSNETIICVVGNLTANPEYRVTPSGAGVASFTIASTPRFFDKQANEFKDAETLYVRCSLWREPAENVCESLTKGTRVIAQGQLKARSFEDREGNTRTSWELNVEDIGPSLRYATARVQRAGKASQGFGGGTANTYDATQNTGFGTPSSGGWPADEPAF